MVRKLLASLLCIFCLLAPASASAAYNPLTGPNGVCQAGGDASQSSACSPHQTPIVGPNGVIKRASSIVATIAGITAIIVIMVGGLQYVVSNGDAQKAANARMAIIGGAIGLGIIVAAQGIILLVLSRLQ